MIPNDYIAYSPKKIFLEQLQIISQTKNNYTETTKFKTIKVRNVFCNINLEETSYEHYISYGTFTLKPIKMLKKLKKIYHLKFISEKKSEHYQISSLPDLRCSIEKIYESQIAKEKKKGRG